MNSSTYFYLTKDEIKNKLNGQTIYQENSSGYRMKHFDDLDKDIRNIINEYGTEDVYQIFKYYPDQSAVFYKNILKELRKIRQNKILEQHYKMQESPNGEGPGR